MDAVRQANIYPTCRLDKSSRAVYEPEDVWAKRAALVKPDSRSSVGSSRTRGLLKQKVHALTTTGVTKTNMESVDRVKEVQQYMRDDDDLIVRRDNDLCATRQWPPDKGGERGIKKKGACQVVSMLFPIGNSGGVKSYSVLPRRLHSSVAVNRGPLLLTSKCVLLLLYCVQEPRAHAFPHFCCSSEVETFARTRCVDIRQWQC